jgi:hypothetical protein
MSRIHSRERSRNIAFLFNFPHFEKLGKTLSGSACRNTNRSFRLSCLRPWAITTELPPAKLNLVVRCSCD